jgi:hypothetical protein
MFYQDFWCRNQIQFRFDLLTTVRAAAMAGAGLLHSTHGERCCANRGGIFHQWRTPSVEGSDADHRRPALSLSHLSPRFTEAASSVVDRYGACFSVEAAIDSELSRGIGFLNLASAQQFYVRLIASRSIHATQ